MPIWDPNSYRDDVSAPSWMPPGGGTAATPPSTVPIPSWTPTPSWLPPGGFPPPPAAPTSLAPPGVGNPNLPDWHPGKYAPATGGSSSDTARGGRDPITMAGQPYTYGQPLTGPGSTGGSANPAPTKSPLLPTVDDLQSNANFAFLQTLLNSYGLGDAYQTMVDLIADDASPAEIELAIRDTPVFRERFSVIFDREGQGGKTPLSPADVINYERQLEGVLSFYGVPDEVGGSVQELAASLLGDDVSLNEVTQRLLRQREFADDVLSDPNMDQAAVASLLGEGVTPYDIANFALDPDKTLSEITQRLQAASISNEAAQANYRIQAEEALALQQGGLTSQQAQQGFGALVQQNQVVDGIGNEVDPVSRAQELAALTGDVAANAAIERARRTRTAAFEVGGGFGRDDDGFGGLR